MAIIPAWTPEQEETTSARFSVLPTLNHNSPEFVWCSEIIMCSIIIISIIKYFENLAYRQFNLLKFDTFPFLSYCQVPTSTDCFF